MSGELLLTIELVVLGVLDAVILFGNVLVIMAFIVGPRRLKTYTNYFIVNLAVADLLVGVLPLPFWIYVRANPSSISPSTAGIFLVFDVTFGCASILNLTLISIERMVAVKYPTSHFNLSWRPVVAVIILTWFVSGFVAGLAFIAKSKIYTLFLFVIVFLLPTVIIVICYTLIFKVAKRSAATNNTKIRRELKTAKMISIIIGLFLFCWLPFFILNMVYTHCTSWCQSIPDEMLQVTKILHYANSMMNVCVYAACSPLFRNAFKAILQRKLKRSQSESNSTFRSNPRRNLTDMDICSEDDVSSCSEKNPKSDRQVTNTSI